MTYTNFINDNIAPYAAAKICVYGTDNSYHYNTTGFEVDVGKSTFQINSSYRYRTNGGTLPITITFNHMRFIKS